MPLPSSTAPVPGAAFICQLRMRTLPLLQAAITVPLRATAMFGVA